MSDQASKLLLDHLELLTATDSSLPILDLACGTGRNGLILAQHGIPVVFADRSASAMGVVSQHLVENALPGRVWHVDLETPETNPFNGQKFSAVIGFRYLHRPLLPALKNAVTPGGVVIYETFTVDNRRFGRPKNPDFLLHNGELKSIFHDWEVLFYFEGIRPDPDRGIAQIVAKKPEPQEIQMP